MAPRSAAAIVPVDPHVHDVVAAAVAAFAGDLGCDVELVPAPLGDLTEATLAIVALETDLAGLKALARGRETELSATVRNLLGKSWKAEQFTYAITLRKAAVNAMARFMQRYDLILTPTVPVTAFPAEASGPGRIAGVPVSDDVWSPYLNPSNLTGQPAVSVPAGWTQEGMPVGLQIVGRRFADGMVLSAAAAFERVRPWNHRHPAHSVWNATQSSQPAERVGQARRTM
jgi:aspartyl-tRNA(Asn)/glutamyl-tRNA(Gln) amidotransferase subunit A